MRKHQAVAFLVLILHGVGCSDDATEPLEVGEKDSSADESPDSGPSGGQGGSAGNDAGRLDSGGEEGVSLTWRVVEGSSVMAREDSDGGSDMEPSPSGSARPALSGVAVCLHGADPETCTTSAGDGTFVLGGLPKNAQTIVTLRKDGYTSLVVPVYTTSTDLNSNTIAAQPIEMTQPVPPGPSFPVVIELTQNGAIAVVAVSLGAGGQSTGAPGVMIEAAPRAGDGPYFIDEANYYDLSATSMVYQAGLYFNVEPGEYEITFSASDFKCSPLSLLFGGYGYPASASSVRVPVLAGHLTMLAGALCSSS